jgi:phenylacetic acid degradation operon negative regulatory protein
MTHTRMRRRPIPDRQPAVPQTAGVHARSALFDLYGDHLLSRGGRAPVAALVRCLATLGIEAPAVRTAVSRMTREGWLEPARLPAGPGYAITPRAIARLEAAAERIYRTDTALTGDWDVLVLPNLDGRSRRERARRGLSYLGYGQLSPSVWVAVRPSAEVEPFLAEESIVAHRFASRYLDSGPTLAGEVWDLDALAATYREFLVAARELMATIKRPTDEQAFAARSQLVHEWRKFLFTDPRLPDDLLPTGWVGQQAARYFDSHAHRLLPAAARFVDSCLGADPVSPPKNGRNHE